MYGFTLRINSIFVFLFYYLICLFELINWNQLAHFYNENFQSYLIFNRQFDIFFQK